ncbi:MAG: TMEM175 family protein [Candidatus Pacebacteria bacterium]|nr:TMEM175 family protein [Candidatus Paceibacterota bacterium]
MHMNKSRIEAFSDGIFAIVMTLLVFEIKIPNLTGPATNEVVAGIFASLWPVVLLYMVSFLVLAVIWINHHFIFHAFAKDVDRQLNLLNMVYLMFVVLVPFTMQLTVSYSEAMLAVIFYGVNLFVIVFISTLMTRYIWQHKELRQAGLSNRLMNQSQFRARLSLIFYPLGILSALVWIPASFFFYTVPVIFNMVPGTLDFLERHSPISFD